MKALRGVPDVRPLGLGECLRRTIHSALVADHKEACEKHFWPQQVAIGIRSGMSLLVYGVRTLLELRPDFIVVKIKCARVAKALETAPGFRGLAPLFRATLTDSPRASFCGA